MSTLESIDRGRIDFPSEQPAEHLEQSRLAEVGPALEDKGLGQFPRFVVDETSTEQLLNHGYGAVALFLRSILKAILQHLKPPWARRVFIVFGLDSPGAVVVRPHRSDLQGTRIDQP